MEPTINLAYQKREINLSKYSCLDKINWQRLTPGEEYDLEHFSRTEDIPFWIESARKYGSPILEIGCGTGRITIPLSCQGYRVYGIDRSDFMIQRLQDKLSKFPTSVQNKVKLVKEDMRNFKLNRKFPLVICCFNTFLNLQNGTDRQNFLSNIRNHLTINGKFILDIVNPFMGNLAPAKNWKFEKENRLNEYFSKRYYKHLEHNKEQQVIKIKFKTLIFDKNLETINKWFFSYTTAYLNKDQTIKLLKENGFMIDNIYGNYDKTPFGKLKNPQTQLIICSKNNNGKR
ncbi:hypothetical protein COX03_00925 [Candidatus Woesebacteria bacterium CG22_combo_CG10-13_8_21_14_all_39_10]|uniref:Methyltransferase domain-containing protein n=2 Tax=Candidatus Woeseibacteriota TaxID=1752722 RepID=A0A2H0BJJ8_9BACT|nr:MAG: hypothetical protein COX03_00925 [Candidatus Woesebacteria bacterium CG22_combo_CG10-13_8_21_14_all_39_10]PIZ49730.1 MAG: hypothetical protein COY29_01130 [Candidatus Woesebacteria bacterium CG_4_10_14_0_2_um_filter_39_14]